MDSFYFMRGHASRRHVLPAQPRIGNIAHVLVGAIAYRSHEIAVESELRPALFQQEAPDVLRSRVAAINDRVPRNCTAVCIEFHAAFPLRTHSVPF